MPDTEALLREGRRLHDRAVADGRFGHPLRAIRTLSRALRLLEQVEGADADILVAEVWLSLAVNEAEVHGVERGLAMIAEAERLVDWVVDPSLRVRLHSNYGFIATRAGDLHLATTQLERALPMIDYATPHDRIYVLLNSGNIRLYRGELGEARALFHRAAEAAEIADIVDGRFRALHNLGYVHFLAGDITVALAAMDAAAALRPDVSLGIWALDRARILLEAGLTREADATLARAGEIFRSERLAQDQGEVEVARAMCALVSGDTAAARRFAGRARTRFKRRGSEPWTRTAELVLLQGDLAAGRPGKRLVGPADRLRGEFFAAGLRLPARTAALICAEAHLAAGQTSAAADTLAEIGPTRRSDPLTVRLHSYYVDARVKVVRGERRLARRQIGRGLRELAAYQASFGSIDMRTASAIHGHQLAELDVALAVEDGKAPAVFAAVELARAVSARMPAVRPPDDPNAASLLAELRSVTESLQAAAHERAASEKLLRRRSELEAEIRARTWSHPGAGVVSRPTSLAATRDVLGRRGRKMVTYLQAGDRLWAVVTEAERSQLVPLAGSAPVLEAIRRARADLDVLAHPRIPQGLRGAMRASLTRSLAELDATLVAPIGPASEPLVMVTTGLLGQVPWGALPSLRGVPVVVAPSATKWVASLAESDETANVAAVAGPDLDRAVEEAHDVAAIWPGGASIPHGSRADLVDSLKTADLVHVAAHGVHQPENPLFSSLRMSDGPLFAHELSGRTPAHVVLSACEVGLATIRPGDEALGLASVLLHLGTSSVVAGVARVNDEQAARVMADYHRRLAGGADSAAALAGALADDDADVVAPFVNLGSAWAARSERTGLADRARVA